METNQNGKFSVDLDLPYPPVQPETHRKEYAYAMLSNVGSDNSEMSAVSLYFYNSILLPPARGVRPVLSPDQHCGDAPSGHLRLLRPPDGAGPPPVERPGGRSHYWTPAYNRYPQQLPALLQNAIQGELAAIGKYRRQAETIQDANIVANLQRIIQDEEHHVRLFRSMLAEVAET